jgi:hypothetical protein
MVSRSRLQDGMARAVDLWIYGPVDDRGLFPLTHSSLLVMACERGYTSLFLGIVLTPMLLVKQAGELRRFVLRTATCYGAGLLVFLIWPVAGPHLAYPESISTAWSGESTRVFMESSLTEFASIRAGGQPMSGFGYFVGYPVCTSRWRF